MNKKKLTKNHFLILGAVGFLITLIINLVLIVLYENASGYWVYYIIWIVFIILGIKNLRKK